MRTVSTVQIFFDSKPDPLNIDPPYSKSKTSEKSQPKYQHAKDPVCIGNHDHRIERLANR